MGRGWLRFPHKRLCLSGWLCFWLFLALLASCLLVFAMAIWDSIRVMVSGVLVCCRAFLNAERAFLYLPFAISSWAFVRWSISIMSIVLSVSCGAEFCWEASARVGVGVKVRSAAGRIKKPTVSIKTKKVLGRLKSLIGELESLIRGLKSLTRALKSLIRGSKAFKCPPFNVLFRCHIFIPPYFGFTPQPCKQN